MRKLFQAGMFSLSFLLCNLPLTASADENSYEKFYTVDEYNKSQIDNAKKFKIEELAQSGGTCVCHTMLNMMMALQVVDEPYSKYELRFKKGSCNDVSFVASYMDFKRVYPGEVFGGVSLLYWHKLVSEDEAILKIVNAIDGGKVVAVSLDADPIYDEYEKNHHLKKVDGYEHIGRRQHAIVIIGMQRLSSGEVSKFIIADSSGPGRIYYVSKKALTNAYGSMNPLAVLNRGVYIPDQRVNKIAVKEWLKKQ